MGLETATVLALIGGAGAGVAASSLMNSGSKVKTPSVEADNSVTAAALPQSSEAAKKNRRLSASLLTEGFATPKLGIPGLDALSNKNVLG